MARDANTPVSIAIVGCVGLPARYGGFETLAANLVDYHERRRLPSALAVYCSARVYPERSPRYGSAALRYLPLDANGASSILYDAWSLVDAARRGDGVILILGVSGAIALPLIRLVSRARLVVNIDGLEWKRPKWSRAAAAFLRLSEWIAVRAAHVVVADNRGIVDHVRDTYGCEAVEIPYGGDHAVARLGARDTAPILDQPAADRAVPYALMLCRIEPENNIHVILDAFARGAGPALVAVGNWETSDYGRTLRSRYRNHPRIQILDPIFDPADLTRLRAGAALYVHGHSAGGTNPALVEMMHFAVPVVAFACNYNRYTTEDAALYFAGADDLATTLATLVPEELSAQGKRMRAIAQRRYTWDTVGRQYFEIMGAATAPRD